MTIRGQDSVPEALEREAHRWVALLVSGEATTADAEELRRWRAQNPDNETAFAAATRRWKDFGPAGRDLREDGNIPAWSPLSPMLSRRAVFGGAGALAASVTAYTIMRPPLDLWPSLSELTADYRTGTGEQRQVVVADNVSVRMNTQTSLGMPASADTGRIDLISGEASFDMPENAQNPLIVTAGSGRTIASRAKFDVRNIGSAVCVTCMDGDVRVEQGTQTVTLGAKRQVRYDGRGLQPVVSIDPTEAAAWQDGVLIFRFTPLSDVVAEINRYRPGKVVLMNAELGSNPVNGRFSVDRLDEVLVWIEQAFGAKSRSLPGGVLLLS